MYTARAILQDSPTGVCASNPFISINFRILCTPWRFPTPFPSITSALFPIQRRGQGSAEFFSSHSSLATSLPFGFCFTLFAYRHLVCFHKNTNCPFYTPFVLKTIQVAGGGGGTTTA